MSTEHDDYLRWSGSDMGLVGERTVEVVHPWRRIGLIPRSKKNRRRPCVIGTAKGPVARWNPSKEAAGDEDMIRDLLEDVKATPIPVENDVRLELRMLVASDAIEWRLVDLGPRDKRVRKGRADLSGVIEALCDALQRSRKKPHLRCEMENDSQVADIRAVRVYEQRKARR